MKRIFIVIAALIIPLTAMAAGGIAKGSPEFSALESLASAGTVSIKQGQEEFSRQEMADMVMKAVDFLLSEDAEAGPEQLETAYMLLMEFETDIMERGVGLSQVQRKMVDLKVKKERLRQKEIREKQDLLFGMIGARINGEAKAYMTDLALYGNAAGAARRYTPLTQYIDLIFTANSGSNLKAEAVFRLENLFGGSWGSQDIYGVRKFTVTGDFPVSFSLGDYRAKLTPFTLWANETPRDSEARVFSDKRRMIKDELYLEGNSWPLTGAEIGYKSGIAGVSFEFSAMAARLQEASKSNYLVSPGASQALVSLFDYRYDQYLWAGRISSDLGLKEILSASINYVQIRDIKGTGTDQSAPALDNYSAAAEVSASLFGIAKAKAEFAYSNYRVDNGISPLTWQNRDISDAALITGLEAEYYGTKAEAYFYVVGNSFTAYGAQAGVYDAYNNYPYLTQNNSWNISQAVPSYILAGKVYPFTRYNNVILSNYFPVGYNMMPHVLYENNAAPFGDSTPNRQGIRLKVSGKYLEGILETFVKYQFASEIMSYLPGSQLSCPREFMVMEGGAKASLWGAELKAGYRYEVTDNMYTGGGTRLESGILDAGAGYTLFGRLRLNAGVKWISFIGTDYPYTWNGSEWAYSSKTKYDANITAIGAGIDFEIMKNASAAVSYTDTKLVDSLAAANNLGAQEIDARVSLKF